MLSGNKVHKPWITKAVKVLHRKRNKLFADKKRQESQKIVIAISRPKLPLSD
ncbi:hypothetical protein DPMN_103023 [Dreissena polymorpha]|uniref:Uncharacterized protein n=1 Tax=Dreissena polymorpha TaxID=45954 RepID=A0A9D4H5E1_DREPO|nr:hypothetical protein DPMN_103023 [Dreissena polymorpha]